MPLQNRVAPDGEICVTAARGTMMGNRGGCFHRDDQTLKGRRWANRQWICCVLEFKARRRKLMQPGLYTELFFLDEATAFAAGHRPCFECRRGDALRFQSLWAKAMASTMPPAAPVMDVVLHDQRLTSQGEKRVCVALTDALPHGAMFRHEGDIHVVADGGVCRWSFDGYGPRDVRPRAVPVEVLTPPAIVAILTAGYRPQLHVS